MTDEEILEEFAAVTELFYQACGYVGLNNIFDYDMAQKINKLDESLICDLGLLSLEFNQNGKIDYSHPTILEICKKLISLGIMERDVETQEIKFTHKIPADYQLDLRNDINAAYAFWDDVADKIKKNPQKILKESEQLNFLIRYVTRMGTMAGYWIPEIYDKFLKGESQNNRILLSLLQPKKFYERLEHECFKKDGLILKDYVKELMDDGFIEDTINEHVMYAIKNYRDFKNIAWPDFYIFTDLVLYKWAELEGKLKEKS
jgi:hypothetical protein